MKLSKLLLVSLLLLTIISLGAVSAHDDLTSETGGGQNLDDFTAVGEVSDDIADEDIQTTGNDDDEILTASDEAVVGEITADNVTVDVSNVFKGQQTTISVTIPEATGTVNIAVGDKIYTPEFIGGVATQTISEYEDGINTVTVNYNGIVKETTFKALDGKVTQETFEDYFEPVIDYYVYFYPRALIPDYATLDFSGYIDIKTLFIPYEYESDIGSTGKGMEIIIDKNLNLISSAKDAVIGYGAWSDSLSSHRNSRVSVNITGITFEGDVSLWASSTVYNSTFKRSLQLDGDSNALSKDIVKNCVFYDYVYVDFNNGTLLENNTFYSYLTIGQSGYIIVKNNFITYDNGDNAVRVGIGSGNWNYNQIINNTIYGQNKLGNDAVVVSKNYNWVEDWTIIENNIPIQIPVNNFAADSSVVYGENITVQVNISAEGNVTFYLGDKKHSAKLIDGIATLVTNEYNKGTIKVVYFNEVTKEGAIVSSTFTIIKHNATMNLTHSNATAGKFGAVNLTLPDDADGNIQVLIDNGIFTLSFSQNANGSQNIIELPALPEGNYTIRTTFSSEKYNTISNSTVISFIYVPEYSLSAKDVVMTYQDGSKYTVLATLDGVAVGEGEIVNITFNGKTVEVKTDANGYATLLLDASPGTYDIIAEYNGVNITNTIKINDKPVQPVKEVPVLKAAKKTVNVKKSAKKLVLKATLKINGKAKKGLKVKLKFNKKTYTAKTNAKGLVKFTIKKSVLKKLKAGKKYTGKFTYGKKTAKTVVKVKK